MVRKFRAPTWKALAIAPLLGGLVSSAAGYQPVTPGSTFNVQWNPLNFTETPVVTLELVAGPYPDLCNNYSGRLVSNTLVCNDGSYGMLIPETETCIGETLFVKITNPWGKFMDYCAAVPAPTGNGILQLASSTSGTSNCPGGGAVPTVTEAAANLPSPTCTANPAGIALVPPIGGQAASSTAQSTTTSTSVTTSSPAAAASAVSTTLVSSSAAAPTQTSALSPSPDLRTTSSPAVTSSPRVNAGPEGASTGGSMDTSAFDGGLSSAAKIGVGVAVLATVLVVLGGVVAYKRRRVPHEELGSYTQMS
ncbi:hypothetical protein HDU93_006036 [Gonapodya sp. JEL0774]|nr:hypothetical protein HDU93_006036 [Gonapodya sp. JEL0774]